MKINRRITSIINSILDDWLPPILRDSDIVMAPLFRLGLGREWREFRALREEAVTLPSDELGKRYSALAANHIQRETDIHPDLVPHIITRTIGDTVLDVGCGRGFLARKIEQSGKSVTGIDFMAPTDESAADGPTFIQSSIERLPFDDNSFDTVICTHTLEHIVNPQIVIQEIRRVAKERIIVVVPKQRPYKHTFDLHLHYYPYPWMVDLLMNSTERRATAVAADIYYEESLA